MQKPSMEKIPVGAFLELAQFEIRCAIGGTGGDPMTMEVMGRSGAWSQTVVVAAKRMVLDVACTQGA